MPLPVIRRPHPRSRFGCFVCRARHKKCDERHPLCSACDRNQLVCSWPAAASKISSGAELPPLPKALRGQGPASDLLRYYIDCTAPRLAGKVDPENPFVTYNLPIAWSNDLLLHVILATSASHLAYISRILRDYVKKLNKVLATPPDDTSGKLNLLSTILALCFFEVRGPRVVQRHWELTSVQVVSCNRQGALFHHLRASRVIIAELQTKQIQLDQALFGFCLEQYCYLAIVSNITHGANSCNGERNTEFLEIPLRHLNFGSKIYGCMFGCSHQLFEVIPRIACLAKCHSFSNHRANESRTKDFEILERRIENWQPTLGLQQSWLNSPQRIEELQIAGNAYQQACLIFLHTSFHGPHPPDTHLFARVDVCTEKFLNYFGQLSTESPAWTTMMWPMIIVGSCLRTARQRRIFTDIVNKSTFQMRIVDSTLRFIQWVWEAYDYDQSTYGPYSIERIIRTKKFNICVA
ncbi:C6 transcription factor, putative [Talaromyces stipitatus ATCC 10500]|uniref:C6 transcription factor, putative n=1 Tax=Talaromyces stipitatus (strain ATCC 10500 / CBS 375.48 / QM 6759 / NRRL 1006) TaxID=441959 RepID=B8MHZ2_TALSN|nr:C6 transcription factor, putative [Talaromyces stipitatus ATCC 10500]EED17154.1 C6 transcription factor, putative [Talaromyces stipitatus ATCC 10500]